MTASITLIFLQLYTDNSLVRKTYGPIHEMPPIRFRYGYPPLARGGQTRRYQQEVPLPPPLPAKVGAIQKKSITATPTLGIPKERTDKEILSL
jgi:hypothetical protein